jgi:hypothetical protein
MANKFVSFLKAAGEVIANGALSYYGLPPLFKTAAPTTAAAGVATEIAALAQAAIQVEAIGKSANLTGAQKLAALEPQVYAILQNALALGGKPIANPTLAAQGASEVAQGIVDFMNGIEGSTVTSAAGSPAPVVGTAPAPAPAAPPAT